MLMVDGRVLRPTNKRVVVPDTGFASIRGLSNADNTNDTLNFTIPAAWVNAGVHALSVQLVCNDPGGKVTASKVMQWTWIAKSPLPVRALWLALYASDSHMLERLRDALDLLPTPLTDIGIAAPGWHPHTYDLSTHEGWSDLIDDVEDAWDDADESSSVRWLGLCLPVNALGGPHLPTWAFPAHRASRPSPWRIARMRVRTN